MKRFTWTLIFILLIATYYLSSVPGLQVLPVLKQANQLLEKINIDFKQLARQIIDRLPEQLAPASTIIGDIYSYAYRHPELIEFFLRKSAHVFLFFIITLALFMLLRQYFKSPGLTIITTFILATLLAFLDEYHQTFTSNRSGNIVDVGVDLVGILLAIMLILFSLFITKRGQG